MAVGGEEQRGRHHRQELPDRRARRAAQGIDHRREAEAHRVADHLAREQGGGEHHLEDEADREPDNDLADDERSEEHTSELQYIMSSSYAVLCLKKKTDQ